MRTPQGRWSHLILWSALLITMVVGDGCQTATKSLFIGSGPGWTVRQGQALWRPRKGMPEVAGDLVVANDRSGRYLIQFDKTPLSLLMAQTTPERWLIRFPARNMGFTGHQPPPARFAWLHLPAALSGEALTPPMQFERKPDGGWRLENTRSGEALEGFLAP